MLNERMDFGCPITVRDGQVVGDQHLLHAPEVCVDVDADGQILAGAERTMIEELARQGWVPLDGYSGQSGYSGPIMHPSEYIGGQIEEDILATDGVYVVVSVECLGPEETDDAAGWMVLRHDSPTYDVITVSYTPTTKQWTVYARPEETEDFERFEGEDTELAELLSIAHDVVTGG